MLGSWKSSDPGRPMREPRDGAADPTVRALERELELVRSAIDLVASGGSSRVSIGSLAFGEELLDAARAMAEEAGVRIVPIWTADDVGAGLAVERITDD
jgi:hypothetical protein